MVSSSAHSEESARGDRGFGSTDGKAIAGPEPAIERNPKVLTSEDVVSMIIDSVLSDKVGSA